MSGAAAPKWDFSDFEEEDEAKEGYQAEDYKAGSSSYSTPFARPSRAATFRPSTSYPSYYSYKYQDTLRPRRLALSISIEGAIIWLKGLSRNQRIIGLSGIVLALGLILGGFSLLLQANTKDVYLFRQTLTTALKTQPQAKATPVMTGSYSVLRSPTISPEKIEAVLRQYKSPATGTGQAMYNLGVRYGIDPAYALAFFIHESSAGTQGVAVTTHSIGNIRCTPGYDCLQTAGNGSFRRYPDWETGIEDWYKLIKELYVGKWGLKTLEQIIPVYAPSADRNNPASYIRHVATMVDTWKR